MTSLKFFLLVVTIFALFSTIAAQNSFAYCAMYSEYLCKLWEPIDSSCRWCPGMGQCAPYCIR